MDQIFPGLSIRMDDKLYIKDPISSELGKKILRKSIELIDSVGMEGFTFKKVAMELGTTESSIYRYFENKHKILLYLMA
jgi:AcrR family transcriptional regulator